MVGGGGTGSANLGGGALGPGAVLLEDSVQRSSKPRSRCGGLLTRTGTFSSRDALTRVLSAIITLILRV